MSHQPPIPPEQLSDKVYGEHSPPDRKPEVTKDPGRGGAPSDAESRGDAGSREQNIGVNKHKL